MTGTQSSTLHKTEDPYFSRVDEWEATPRVDPIIWQETSHTGPWSGADLSAYQQDGFLFKRQLFDADEAAAMLTEADRLAKVANPHDEGVVAEPGSRIVRSIFRLHRISDLFQQICRDPRLVNAARQILGSEVYIHQSRINYKPAFDGKEFFWHSDFETWHVEDGMPRMRAVSISLSLTETNPFNGPLIVVPGSHQMFIRCAGQTPENHFEKSLRKQEYGVPSRDAMTMLVDQGGMAAPTGPAGSALFFECNTMHGSASNISPFPRTNLFVVFNSVPNAVCEPFGDQPPRPEYLAEREFDAVTPT